jgi:hypothetical protein
LVRNFNALHQHFTLNWPREIEALAYRTRGGQNFIG